jgi:hypothetical protein
MVRRFGRDVAGQTFTNLQRWSVIKHGGHFTAMEQPSALAQEVRAVSNVALMSAFPGQIWHWVSANRHINQTWCGLVLARNVRAVDVQSW